MNMNRFWPAIALAVTLILTACGGEYQLSLIHI